MSKQIVVVLTNKAIPYNAVGTLRGMSGVKYADSIYEDAYGAHVARMSVEDYRKAKDDIALGQMRRFNQWSIDFEEVATPLGELITNSIMDAANSENMVEKFIGSPNSGKLLISTEQHPETAQPQSQSPSQVKTASETHSFVCNTPESLVSLKYFALVKIAKQLGIDADKIDGSEPLRKAILEKQAVAA